MSLRRIRALPCWTGRIVAEPLKGGLSNESWRVTDDAGTHVVRFGRDYPFHHVSRTAEVMAARAAHEAGFAPKVEYAARGVMVSEFLVAKTWTEDDMRAGPGRIGRLLHDFHRRMPALVSGQPVIFWVFHVIRDYANLLTKEGTRPLAEVEWLRAVAAETEAAQVPLPIIFGHHDLLPGNILESPGGRLWMIDFEYAGFGTAMFDLAGAASNASMNADEAHAMLVAYFGQPPEPAVMRAFDAMQCASLAREAMWAMVSALHLAVPGADYMAHATEYLGRLETALDRYHTRYGRDRK